MQDKHEEQSWNINPKIALFGLISRFPSMIHGGSIYIMWRNVDQARKHTKSDKIPKHNLKILDSGEASDELLKFPTTWEIFGETLVRFFHFPSRWNFQGKHVFEILFNLLCYSSTLFRSLSSSSYFLSW